MAIREAMIDSKDREYDTVFGKQVDPATDRVVNSIATIPRRSLVPDEDPEDFTDSAHREYTDQSGDLKKSTAGQAGPSMSMEKSCDQLSDVDGAFGKSADTGTTPVGDELQGPECDSSASTGAKDVDSAMRKSMENDTTAANTVGSAIMRTYSINSTPK